MIKIGITGGIASGKTTASVYFKNNGDTFIFHADKESKRYLKKSRNLQKKIIHVFGNEVVVNNKLNFELLAKKAFSDPINHKILNGIMWPEIYLLINNSYNEQKHKEYKFFVVDAAVIFEANFQSFFDKTILVVAKKDLRIERAIKRNNLPLESIQNRISLQMSDNMKKKLSDYIIINDKSELNLKNRINKIYLDLLN